MTLMDLIREKRLEILSIAKRHGAHNIRVFGSVVREDARSDSDIDLLVSTTSETSPWFPAGLVLDLQELLGRNVDIVTERGLNPYIRDRVLSEARPI